MYAIIKTGGKQYRVQEGDELHVELLKNTEDGSEVVFDQVLMIGGDDTKIGQPVVEGAEVKATVVRNGRARKVIVFKSNRRKGYRRKKGHRQSFSKIRIDSITH
ncbi:MAG: 50S ribosomal protein L21 [Myxococcales bacterium]|nr:50S ribosomal protein L21 [Myxococcales bacterium]